jgi:cytochrome c551/c552
VKGYFNIIVALFALAATPVLAADREELMLAGAKLFRTADCVTCHAIDKKVVGPAFKEIAARYKGDSGAEDRLTEKVRKGGSGSWGPVAMVPHADMSEEDLRTLVKWVLAQ